MPSIKNISVTPLMTAAAVIIAQAFIMAFAFAASVGQSDPAHVWLIPAVAVLGGAMAYVFHARGWHALLLAFLVGLVVGDISALDLANQPVEQLFAVSSATVGFFAMLGLLIGAVAEAVRLVHYLLHHGRIRFYPSGEKASKPEKES